MMCSADRAFDILEEVEGEDLTALVHALSQLHGRRRPAQFLAAAEQRLVALAGVLHASNASFVDLAVAIADTVCGCRWLQYYCYVPSHPISQVFSLQE